MHSTQPSIWCKRNCDSSESVVQLSSSDAHVPLLLGFGSGWGVSMGTLTGFMQPYIKKKNGNPLCILILFYGDRIQHRRELALHFFGNLILQRSSPMCIIEPCPLMMLSLGHHCVFLGPFLRVTEIQFFPFYRGNEYDWTFKAVPCESENS